MPVRRARQRVFRFRLLIGRRLLHDLDDLFGDYFLGGDDLGRDLFLDVVKLLYVPPPPEDEDDQAADEETRGEENDLFELMDLLLSGRIVELFADPVSQEHKQPAADDRREAVDDEELDEVEADGAGDKDDRAADTREETSDAYDADAVDLEQLFHAL